MFCRPFEAVGLGNGNDIRSGRTLVERHLCQGFVGFGGHLRQNLHAALALESRPHSQTPVVERCVGHDRDLVFLTVRQEVTFDVAAVEVVKKLTGDNRVALHCGLSMAQFRQGKITDADVTDLPAVDDVAMARIVSAMGTLRLGQWKIGNSNAMLAPAPPERNPQGHLGRPVVHHLRGRVASGS